MKRRGSGLLAGAMAAALCLLTSGCAPTAMKKQVSAVSGATAPVVDEATAAYQAVNTIHDLSEDYEAALAFDKTDPVYDPSTVEPFLTQAQIDARLAVLKGLQTYVQTLVTVTGSPETPALDTASKSLGSSLTSLANSEAPEVKKALAVKTTTTKSAPKPAVSKEDSNILTTGINLLGQFLISQKVKEELPAKVKEMDPQVKGLCDVLAKETDILAEQEKIDYETVIDLQTAFLRRTPKNEIDAEARREQIMKLPGIVRQERASLQQLAQLKDALGKLKDAHAKLTKYVEENKPASLKDELGELETAGTSLGKFYSSLPTK